MSDSPAIVETVGGQLAMASAIDTNLERIKQEKHELKTLKEMLQDTFDADPDYLELKEQHKLVTKDLKAEKTRLEGLNQSQVDKIDAKKELIADLKSAAANNALTYWYETKQNVIDLPINGQHDISIKASIKRR